MIGWCVTRLPVGAAPAGVMSITEFLLARIAEEEALARNLDDPDGSLELVAAQDTAVVMRPARLFAEIRAKRRLIEVHPGASDVGGCPGCGDSPGGTWRTPPGHTCPVLAALALEYADHPDYRREWRA